MKVILKLYSAVGERDQNVDKLATLIDKDIVEMEKELREVKQEIQDPSILDINTEMATIKVQVVHLYNQK